MTAHCLQYKYTSPDHEWYCFCCWLSSSYFVAIVARPPAPPFLLPFQSIHQVPRETVVMLIRLLHLLTPIRPHRLLQRTVLNLCAGHPAVRWGSRVSLSGGGMCLWLCLLVLFCVSCGSCACVHVCLLFITCVFVLFYSFQYVSVLYLSSVTHDTSSIFRTGFIGATGKT